jgi:hypothetical protein
LRRRLAAQIQEIRDSLADPIQVESLAIARQIMERSSTLQVHAIQTSRGTYRTIVEEFSRALARDAKAARNDIKPRLVAAQVLSLVTTLFTEAERRRRAGQSLKRITNALELAADTALTMLEHGFGDYGSCRR